jgi:hypothetical protein
MKRGSGASRDLLDRLAPGALCGSCACGGCYEVAPGVFLHPPRAGFNQLDLIELDGVLVERPPAPAEPERKPKETRRLSQRVELLHFLANAADDEECFERICIYERQGIHAVCVSGAGGGWEIWRAS